MYLLIAEQANSPWYDRIFWVVITVIVTVSITEIIKKSFAKKKPKYLHAKESLDTQIIEVPSALTPNVRLQIEGNYVLNVMIRELTIRNMTDEKINDINLVINVENYTNHITAQMKSGEGLLSIDHENKNIKLSIKHLKPYAQWGAESVLAIGTDSRFSELKISSESEDWGVYHTKKKEIENRRDNIAAAIVFLCLFGGVASMYVLAGISKTYPVGAEWLFAVVVFFTLISWSRRWIAKKIIKYKYWN